MPWTLWGRLAGGARAPLLALAALGALIWVTAAPSAAGAGAGELERLVRKDGTAVIGVVIGFSDGAYRVQVGERIVEVPAKDIRTIEPTGERAPVNASPTSAAAGWAQRIAGELGARDGAVASAESLRVFADVRSALLRGDRDFALRGARGVAEAEPRWVDPLLVMLVLETESGHETEALRLALRVANEFPDDSLAIGVAAEVFRRGGFPIRAAELEESARLRTGDAADRRELVRMWWPLDPERALVHWQAVLDADPGLERGEFPEAELLRKARSAIALGDLLLAAQWIEEASRLAPWAKEQVLAERISLAEARLDQAELDGDLPLAILAAEALGRLGGAEDPELAGRLSRMRDQGIARALEVDDAAELARWTRQHSHLFAGAEGAAASVAARLAELGLAALARGETEVARDALALAREIAPEAEPPETARLVAEHLSRAVAALTERQEESAFEVLLVLHEFLPAHDGIAVERLRELLESSRPGTWSETERRAIAGRLAALYGGAGAVFGAIANPALPPPRPAALSGAAASMEGLAPGIAEVAKWFPIAVGTRWTYRLSDGLIEEREVLASGEDGQGGWLVVMRVAAQGHVPYETRAWIRDGALCLGHPTAPPGEILLNGAVAPGETWRWNRDAYTYRREVEPSTGPVETPAGVFEEVRVIHAVNTLEAGDDDRSWSAEHRITFAAGIGVVRIDGDAPGIGRVLTEFRAGTGAIGSSAPDADD